MAHWIGKVLITDDEEEAIGIGGGLEFNLGHKRKTNVKLDAIFENRKAKQVYELVDVSTDVKLIQ